MSRLAHNPSAKLEEDLTIPTQFLGVTTAFSSAPNGKHMEISARWEPLCTEIMILLSKGYDKKQPPNTTLAKGSSLAYSGHAPDVSQGSGKVYFNCNLLHPFSLSLSLILMVSYITCNTVTRLKFSFLR